MSIGVFFASPKVSAEAPRLDGARSRLTDGVLGAFRPLFTAPSFRAFRALAAGFLAQAGRRTVCGMLTDAGLSQVWRHDRAHRFFSHARWSR